jgi:hypothetical protein
MGSGVATIPFTPPPVLSGQATLVFQDSRSAGVNSFVQCSITAGLAALAAPLAIPFAGTASSLTSIALDIGAAPPGTTVRSEQLSDFLLRGEFPIVAGNAYRLWVDSLQNVYAQQSGVPEAVSNFECILGPAAFDFRRGHGVRARWCSPRGERRMGDHDVERAMTERGADAPAPDCFAASRTDANVLG